MKSIASGYRLFVQFEVQPSMKQYQGNMTFFSIRSCCVDEYCLSSFLSFCLKLVFHELKTRELTHEKHRFCFFPNQFIILAALWHNAILLVTFAPLLLRNERLDPFKRHVIAHTFRPQQIHNYPIFVY